MTTELHSIVPWEKVQKLRRLASSASFNRLIALVAASLNGGIGTIGMLNGKNGLVQTYMGSWISFYTTDPFTL